MKKLISAFLFFPLFLFGADAANDIILTQRNSGNTGNVQRNVTGTANSLIGTNGSSVPVIITAGSGINIAAGVITATGGGTGTVTSVSFTGGLISVATATTTPALTVAGTSGGVPYFSSASTWASSAALAANALMIGGGAGVAPSTTTTATNMLTFLGSPTSANLAATVTNETGTGLLVFATDPTFTLTDITTNNSTTSQHGWLPKLGGGTTNFLRADGTWAAPGGSGTVTVVSSGSLTSNALVTGGGTTTLQTIASGSTLDSSGNLVTAGTVTTGNGSGVAGGMFSSQGTAPTPPANSVGYYAPASLATAYGIAFPATITTGVVFRTGTSNPQTESIIAVTGTGNVVLATDPTFTLTDITTNNASTSQHGWLPKLGGGTTNFLRADGTWAAPSGGGGATLGANTFTAKQTITQASANAGIIGSTGYSLTGSDASNMLDFAGTWNTSGVPTLFKMNVTNTASGSGALLVDWQVGGSSKFNIDKDGTAFLAQGMSMGGSGFGCDYQGNTTTRSLRVNVAGESLTVESGSNAMAGTVTLSSGAATITSSAITTKAVIILTLVTSSGTPGLAEPRTSVATGSATIAGAATDNSTYNWVALKYN